jgi:hypothetical protein
MTKLGSLLRDPKQIHALLLGDVSIGVGATPHETREQRVGVTLP